MYFSWIQNTWPFFYSFHLNIQWIASEGSPLLCLLGFTNQPIPPSPTLAGRGQVSDVPLQPLPTAPGLHIPAPQTSQAPSLSLLASEMFTPTVSFYSTEPSVSLTPLSPTVIKRQAQAQRVSSDPASSLTPCRLWLPTPGGTNALQFLPRRTLMTEPVWVQVGSIRAFNSHVPCEIAHITGLLCIHFSTC